MCAWVWVWACGGGGGGWEEGGRGGRILQQSLHTLCRCNVKEKGRNSLHVYNYEDAMALDRLAWIFHHILRTNIWSQSENTEKTGQASLRGQFE